VRVTGAVITRFRKRICASVKTAVLIRSGWPLRLQLKEAFRSVDLARRSVGSKKCIGRSRSESPTAVLDVQYVRPCHQPKRGLPCSSLSSSFCPHWHLRFHRPSARQKTIGSGKRTQATSRAPHSRATPIAIQVAEHRSPYMARSGGQRGVDLRVCTTVANGTAHRSGGLVLRLSERADRRSCGSLLALFNGIQTSAAMSPKGVSGLSQRGPISKGSKDKQPHGAVPRGALACSWLYLTTALPPPICAAASAASGT
jgi:hypothetical protein